MGQKLVGTTIAGRYKVESLLGSGGMGSVYLVQHAAMRKRYALKVLNSQTAQQPEMVARFEREALAAAHIDHPNIAVAIDFGKTEDGAFFLVLEYLEGQRLRDALAAGPMDVRRALHITRQIASALERTHQQGIIHRDLKPDNIMLVSRQKDRDFVKVLDFGLAKVEKVEPGSDAPAQVLTKLGTVCGTPKYMAPEQCVGESLDGRADLYALGLILFEMLTGVHPFASDDISRTIRHQLTTPTPPFSRVAPNVRVPASLEAVVMRLTAKQPENRYDSATALLAALAEVAEKEGILPPEPSAVGMPPSATAAPTPADQPGSVQALSAADVRVEPSLSTEGATRPAIAKPEAAVTVHSIDIVSEKLLPAAAQDQTLPPAAAKVMQPAAAPAAVPAKVSPGAADKTRPAMAAATLAAFSAAAPVRTDDAAPAPNQQTSGLPPALLALHGRLPAPLRQVSPPVVLGGAAVCAMFLLFILLRTCG